MEEHRQSTDRDSGLTPPEIYFPNGYNSIRILSERNGSWVHLAANGRGENCCVKTQKLSNPASLDAIVETRTALVPLSRNRGFIPIRNWGFCRDTLTVWEELDLADDAISGKPFCPACELLYTPLTLAAYVRENGPIATIQLLDWAAQICSALVSLHQANLFHRDIKPVNILIYKGQCVIADYGSVGKSGSSIEFPGTEGYVPPDGMGSPALDVFALGRSLYEAWTGLDRFQFPSLPKCIVDASDWKIHGWQLNKILSEAADKRISHRIPSAAMLLEKLRLAQHPQKRISRRQAVTGMVSVATGGLGFYIWKSISPFKAIWRKFPPSQFGYEHYRPTELTCDWEQGLLYSIYSDSRGTFVQSVNLKTFVNTKYSFPPTNQPLGYGVYMKSLGELWAAENVSGKIFRFDTQRNTISSYNKPSLDFLGFTGIPYFNSVTRRIGQFSGYGDFKCHNQRREFDVSNQQWNLINEGSNKIPYPRYFNRQYPLSTTQTGFQDRILFFGGVGSATGKQFDRVASLKWYDGKFYPLNDLWELDLQSNRWRQLLHPQIFNPTALKSVICHNPSNSILFLTGSEPGQPQEARFSRTSGLVDEIPKPLPNHGDIIEMFEYWCVLVNPENGHLMVFADEGVFDVSIVPA